MILPFKRQNVHTARVSDRYGQDVAAEEILVLHLPGDAKGNARADVVLRALRLLDLHAHGGVEGKAVITKTQNDVISPVDHTDIQRMRPLPPQGKAVPDDIAGHLFQRKPGQKSPTLTTASGMQSGSSPKPITVI